MKSSANRAMDLMARLSDDELRNVLTRPTEKGRLRLYLNALERDIVAFAGVERYKQIWHSPEARYCQTPMELGYLLWAEMLERQFVSLCDLLNLVARRVEQAHSNADLPSILGTFVAHQSVRFVSGIFRGDQAKYVEIRTALQFVAATAILNVDVDIAKKMIHAAVKATGYRFAAFFNPNFAQFEYQAHRDWFDLQTPETVQRALEWMYKAVELGAFKRRLVLVPQIIYLPSGQEYREAPFPTPFLNVPQKYWKQAVMKDDTFPADILQGKVPLVPINPKQLFLTMSRKQVPQLGVYGPKGTGKSTILYAIGAWSVDRGCTVFQPGMPRDQGLNVILPCMKYMHDEYEYLTKKLKIRPGVSC